MVSIGLLQCERMESKRVNESRRKMGVAIQPLNSASLKKTTKKVNNDTTLNHNRNECFVLFVLYCFAGVCNKLAWLVFFLIFETRFFHFLCCLCFVHSFFDINKWFKFIVSDVKSSLTQSETMHQLHSERNIHAKGVHQHSPTHHLNSNTPTSRSHSISSSSTSSASVLHHHPTYSMHSTSTTNSPTSHTNAPSNHSLIGQTVIPTKYDFGHNTHGSQTSTANLTSNLTANSNYIHSANNLQTPLSYNNVKSESNAGSNFDYMNSCLQNGYFNSSYGAITSSSASATHPVSDLSSYHHIQAAKLMATS